MLEPGLERAVTVLTVLDIRGGRNFSNYGIRIYDPLTARICRPGIDTPVGTPC